MSIAAAGAGRPRTPAAVQDDDPQRRTLVGALASGVRILRHLAAASEPLGVSQVARELELNPSTCFNLLRTLAHENLAAFDTRTRKYAIGLGAVELARTALRKASHVAVVRPYLEAIAAEHRVTATLWQRVGADRVVLVDRAESGTAMQIHMQIGQRLPLTVAALGRCMAAQAGFSKAELVRVFAGLRWQAAPTLAQYVRQIEEARRLGYGVDRDQFVKGVTTASAVVLGRDGVPVSAISAVGFSAQFSDASLAALGNRLRKAADSVTRLIAEGT